MEAGGNRSRELIVGAVKGWCVASPVCGAGGFKAGNETVHTGSIGTGPWHLKTETLVLTFPQAKGEGVRPDRLPVHRCLHPPLSSSLPLFSPVQEVLLPSSSEPSPDTFRSHPPRCLRSCSQVSTPGAQPQATRETWEPDAGGDRLPQRFRVSPLQEPSSAQY